MNIGYIPNPRDWEHWPQAEAYLEPARKLGGFNSVIDPDEALWAAMEDGELLGCATAWLGDGFVEVKLIGGRDHRRWIPQMDELIGRAAREAGASWLHGMGRKGWTKTLLAHGWERLGENEGMTFYRRELRG